MNERENRRLMEIESAAARILKDFADDMHDCLKVDLSEIAISIQDLRRKAVREESPESPLFSKEQRKKLKEARKLLEKAGKALNVQGVDTEAILWLDEAWDRIDRVIEESRPTREGWKLTKGEAATQSLFDPSAEHYVGEIGPLPDPAEILDDPSLLNQTVSIGGGESVTVAFDSDREAVRDSCRKAGRKRRERLKQEAARLESQEWVAGCAFRRALNEVASDLPEGGPPLSAESFLNLCNALSDRYADWLSKSEALDAFRKVNPDGI